MMAGKARLFGDATIERAIVASVDPREVKALGRKIAGFEVQVWSRHKVGTDHACGGSESRLRVHSAFSRAGSRPQAAAQRRAVRRHGDLLSVARDG
tara:strand:+ start:3347 stop:3634 length:288 start_codon:yes stop_codon:yes gene_type:complete